MKKYGWLVQYGVTMMLALGFGALLSQVPLFHETSLGTSKLRAAQGVQFLGFAGALLVLWQFGQRVARELPSLAPKMKFLCPVIMPFTSLMVLIASHPVGGLVLHPFLGKSAKGVYNWMFVIGIISAALWVVIAWYTKAAPLLQTWEESSEQPLEVKAGSREPHYVSSTGEEPA
jgi:hypothetical protein